MICLIRPPAVECVRFTTSSISPPLGLAYITAAYERAGAKVKVIDSVGAAPERVTRYYKGFLVGLRFAEILSAIPAECDFVGVSAIFTHEWPAIVEMVRRLRAARPDVFIVIGGEHVTSMPEFSLATSEADALVLGEGEESAVALWQAYRDGKEFSDISGVAYREGNAIHVNPRRARRRDVDAIPRPAWKHFDLRSYHDNRMAGGIYTGEMSVPLLATRGCPYQCTYCSSPNMWTTTWVPRDPVEVADEIEDHVRDLGARNFPLQDLTAIIKKEWVVKFCHELIRRNLGITWQFPSGTRCEVVDSEVAELLKRSNMINMNYAPETGSDESRKLIKKQMKTERMFESIRSAVNEDLSVSLFFVIGFPHDTADSVRLNLDFVRRAAHEGARDIAVGYYMALPGTQLFRSLDRAGKIRLDRNYFRHILHGIALIPTTTYCEALNRAELTYWKLRIYWAFYSAKRETQEGTAWTRNFRRAISAFSKQSDNKLATALRHGLIGFAKSLTAIFAPRWLSPRDEREIFRHWDAIHRRILREKEKLGMPVLESTNFSELHLQNIAPTLRADHGTGRSLSRQVVTDHSNA